jgi:hypothetical protein
MRDFFKGSLGCLPMLLCLGGCVYLMVNKIERTNQDRAELENGKIFPLTKCEVNI